MKPLTTIALLMFLPILLIAHGDNHKHKKKDTLSTANTINQKENFMQPNHPETHEMSKMQLPESTDEFPSFHPLAVHFPVVLILLSLFLQCLVIILNRKELNLLVFFFAFTGFAGAIVAARFVHPHTIELSPVANALLEKHELFATYTIWLSGIAVLAKTISFFFKKKIIEWMVGLIMILAAAVVSLTGHHGAELVHKFGIGPKGNFLEHNHDL